MRSENSPIDLEETAEQKTLSAQVQMNYSLLMIQEVAKDPEFGPQARVYAPARTVAFSKREALMPGFDRAWALAQDMGYQPVLRTTGGRTVVYNENALVFDLVIPEPRLRYQSSFIFKEFGLALVGTLRSMAVDARLGPVPKEFCPGAYSVNARNKTKLIGTAQRAASGARLISGVLQLSGADEIREVLSEVNQALNFDWDPATVGALDQEIGSFDPQLVKHFLGDQIRAFGNQLFRQDYS
jgi:lipoate-protein ligase A